MLDRRILIGEPRLSDAQVIALRQARFEPIRFLEGRGWRAQGGATVNLGTVRALGRMGLLSHHIEERPDAPCRSSAAITERGLGLLRALTEAARAGRGPQDRPRAGPEGRRA